MIFSEIYSCYYLTIAEMLKCAVKGELDDAAFNEIAESTAFQDSAYYIRSILKKSSAKNDWQEDALMPLLYQQNAESRNGASSGKSEKKWCTPIIHTPNLPMTLLEKRWMKALLSDPKIKLFDVDVKGLEDVEPLFTPDTFVYFDQNGSGDPYEDSAYIANFRTILKALHKGENLLVSFRTRSGDVISEIITPHHLEYSEKDDCFRLYAASEKRTMVVPVVNIHIIKLDSSEIHFPWTGMERKELTVMLRENSKRSVLERFMIGFSYFEKAARKLDELNYRIKIKYDLDEESSLLIQLLSFGPYLKVTEPETLVESIRSRLEKQIKLNEKSTKTSHFYVSR